MIDDQAERQRPDCQNRRSEYDQRDEGVTFRGIAAHLMV
jgi:hypothetical protein